MRGCLTPGHRSPVSDEIEIAAVSVAWGCARPGSARHCERQAALNSNNSGELPSAKNFTPQAFFVFEKRKSINEISHKNVTSVEKCRSFVRLRIILHTQIRGFGVEICKSFTPCVGQASRKSVPQAFLNIHLHAVIARRSGIFLEIDRTVAKKLPNRISGRI